MAKRVKIPGRLESAETGGIVTGTEAVMDDEKGKTQVVINSEVDAAIISLAQGKQDALTFDSAPTEDSPNPVTSAGVYTADKVLSDAIEAILLLIPSAASALNKLVDMQTMNSSIATATASFKGTYNLVSDLHLGVDATHEQIGAALDALSLGADNNDYAFVQVPNSATAPTEIRVTERYKFNGTNWLFEYDLNNSGFTQGQWNAINSGVTSLLVGKLSDLPTDAELTTMLAGKQDNLTFDNVPTAGSPNPVKSGGVYARNNEIVALINALDAAKQDVLTFDNAPVEGSPNPVKSGGVYTAISAVQAAIVALDAEKQNVLTFDSTPTLGSANPVWSSGIKTELNRIDGNITTLNDLYEALTKSALVIVQPSDTWPVASPATKTIYRVVDRVNTPPQYYSDYMWNGSAMVLMATYDNAIDPVPTAGSNNLVKSGGVFSEIPCRHLEIDASMIQEGKFLDRNGATQSSQWYNIYRFDISSKKLLFIKQDIASRMDDGYVLAAIYDANDALLKVVNRSVNNVSLYSGTAILGDDLSNAEILKVVARSASGVNVNYSDTVVFPEEITDEFLTNYGLLQNTIGQSKEENYIINLDGSTTVAGNWKTHFFEVKKDHKYILYSSSASGVDSSRSAVSLIKDNKLIETLYRSVSQQRIYYAEVVVNSDADYIAVINDRGSVWCYEVNANYIISRTQGDALNSKVLLPNTLYVMPHVGGGKAGSVQSIFNRLYVEGIAKEKLPNLKINGMPNVIADVETNKVAGIYQKPVTISADGYMDYKASLTIKSSDPSNAFNKSIRLMCVGDSLTDHAYPTLVETIYKQLGIENGNQIGILMVGTKLDNIDGTVGDYTFRNRACNEGRSSWAVSDYLRHFCATACRYQTASETIITEKALWDSLGLATKTRNGVPGRASRIDWSGFTEEKGHEVRTTCHGYYDADPSAELWDWIVNKRRLSTFTYNGTVYTFGSSYSTADDAAQKAAIKYLCENWNINPFYNYATVSSSDGQYAFNFEEYLNKFKTLQNNGKTRLVVGSTAGSLVVNADAYDVCTPTHVAIIMAQNDWNNTSNGVEVADDMLLMSALIKSYNSLIEVSIASNRYYGAFNPDMYSMTDGVIKQYDVSNYQTSLYERLLDLSQSHSEVSFLPLFGVQTVIGDTLIKGVDTLDQEKKNMYNGDLIHTRVSGYLDRAYLVSSWILSTL